MPVLKNTPSPKTASRAWTRGFAKAVRDAAGDSGRMTRNKAAQMSGMYADNVQNYFEKSGRQWINADDLIASGARYSQAALSEAAGADNRLSLVDIRSLPADLKDDLLVLRGKAPEGTVERTLKGAVDAFGHPDISDYGKFATQKNYPAGTSRLDILRDFSGLDDFDDTELNGWFHSTKGDKAITDFETGLAEVASEELEVREGDDSYTLNGPQVKDRFEALIDAAKTEFGSLSNVELLEHYIQEDGDVEYRALLGTKSDGSLSLLVYEDFPF